MNRALVGTLLVTCLTIGCSKEGSEKPAGEQHSNVRKSKSKSKSKGHSKPPAPAPEPALVTDCTYAQGEHARPPSLTFQNGLTLTEEKGGNDKDKPKAPPKDKGKSKPYAGTTDAIIDAAAPTSNVGAEPTLVQRGGKKPRRGRVRWDLASLPANTTIQGACMAVFVEEPSAKPYAVYELLRDWSESKVTWDSATADTAWATPGAWGEADAGPQATTILAKAGGLQTVALPTALVQKWITEQAANHGVLIAGSGRAFDSLALSSANSPTATQRPALLIWK
jgi:hypothetical protein